MTIYNNQVDDLLASACAVMKVFAVPQQSARDIPSIRNRPDSDAQMSDSDRRTAGALMRVNHVGEVCAQALYEGQAITTSDDSLRGFYRRSAQEEADHLAWTRQRLKDLGARPSLLNPLWFAGAFALGALAGKLGDRVSLGFTVETERQVEQHLAGHLERLPAEDAASRAIVSAMKDDEAAHADAAQALGASELPAPVKGLMRAAAWVMTTTAHRI
jgi:ubiquinone biosynthesis monooxygenase Coq7